MREDRRLPAESSINLALRPALSLKQLKYKPEADLVRHRPVKGRADSPAVLEWSGVEFVGRVAALIPPPRKHLVRYYGLVVPAVAAASHIAAANMRDRP